MPKFTVYEVAEVTSYFCFKHTVEAESPDEAEAIALDGCSDEKADCGLLDHSEYGDAMTRVIPHGHRFKPNEEGVAPDPFDLTANRLKWDTEPIPAGEAAR